MLNLPLPNRIIARIMDTYGFDHLEFASKTGVEKRSISQWVCGEHSPAKVKFLRIINKFHNEYENTIKELDEKRLKHKELHVLLEQVLKNPDIYSNRESKPHKENIPLYDDLLPTEQSSFDLLIPDNDSNRNVT